MSAYRVTADDTYVGTDLSHLFTLRIKLRIGDPSIIIHAFDGNRTDGLRNCKYYGSHNQIDVEVRMAGEVIFPRGALYCGLPSGSTLDGIEAKELVMALVAMRPGDTDSDYFTSYTPEQLRFADTYGEEIGCEREYRYCDENGAVRK